MKPAGPDFLIQAICASLGQLLEAGLAFADLLILVRLIGPEAYGVFANVLVCVRFCEILVGGYAGDGVSALQNRAPATAPRLPVCWCSAGLSLEWGCGSRGTFSHALDIDQAGPVIVAANALPVLTAMTTVPSQLLVRGVRFSVSDVPAPPCAADAKRRVSAP